MSNGYIGKGDARRPMEISEEEFASRWEMAFSKKIEKKKKDMLKRIKKKDINNDECTKFNSET